MKDNKIIAEFMGLETETFNSGIVNYYHQDIGEVIAVFEEHELSYNVSWDWLMPVVIKIETDDEIYETNYICDKCKDACDIQDEKEYEQDRWESYQEDLADDRRHGFD